MNIKCVKVLLPNIHGIHETIDMFYNIDSCETPSNMIESMCDKYWFINNTNDPDTLIMMTTDMLLEDLKYDDELKLYNTLKYKYPNDIVKFIHPEFNFKHKYIDMIETLIKNDDIDTLHILLYNNNTKLYKYLITGISDDIGVMHKLSMIEDNEITKFIVDVNKNLTEVV